MAIVTWESGFYESEAEAGVESRIHICVLLYGFDSTVAIFLAMMIFSRGRTIHGVPGLLFFALDVVRAFSSLHMS